MNLSSLRSFDIYTGRANRRPIMKSSLNIAIIAVMSSLSFQSHAIEASTPPVPGNFDSFVLAMGDENDFCAANPTKAECQKEAGTWGMALHGLWPDQKEDYKNRYQYCSSVTASEIGPDWCAANLDIRSTMDPVVFLELSLAMPGTDSCLYNHEWYAHGTCSGIDMSTYFDMAASLALTFKALPNFQLFLALNSGQSVSKNQLMDALTSDLGPEAKDAAVFLCRKDPHTSQSHFQEVDINLDRSNLMLFPDPSSLGHSKQYQKPDGTLVPDSGNCPTEGVIITSATN